MLESLLIPVIAAGRVFLFEGMEIVEEDGLSLIDRCDGPKI